MRRTAVFWTLLLVMLGTSVFSGGCQGLKRKSEIDKFLSLIEDSPQQPTLETATDFVLPPADLPAAAVATEAGPRPAGLLAPLTPASNPIAVADPTLAPKPADDAVAASSLPLASGKNQPLRQPAVATHPLQPSQPQHQRTQVTVPEPVGLPVAGDIIPPPSKSLDEDSDDSTRLAQLVQEWSQDAIARGELRRARRRQRMQLSPLLVDRALCSHGRAGDCEQCLKRNRWQAVMDLQQQRATEPWATEPWASSAPTSSDPTNSAPAIAPASVQNRPLPIHIVGSGYAGPEHVRLSGQPADDERTATTYVSTTLAEDARARRLPKFDAKTELILQPLEGTDAPLADHSLPSQLSGLDAAEAPAEIPPVELGDWDRRMQQTLAVLELELQSIPPGDAASNQSRFRLLHLLADNMLQATEPLAGFSPVEQQAWNSQLIAIGEMMRVNDNQWRSMSDSQRQDAIQNCLLELRAAVEQLALAAPLQIQHPCLCDRIDGFADYSLVEDLQPGQTVLLYCELDNLASRPVQYKDAEGQQVAGYGSRLTARLEIVNLAAPETPLESWQFDDIEDHSRRPRRDFFVVFPFVVPELPADRYQLKLFVEDLCSGRQTLCNEIELEVL